MNYDPTYYESDYMDFEDLYGPEYLEELAFDMVSYLWMRFVDNTRVMQ